MEDLIEKFEKFSLYLEKNFPLVSHVPHIFETEDSREKIWIEVELECSLEPEDFVKSVLEYKCQFPPMFVVNSRGNDNIISGFVSGVVFLLSIPRKFLFHKYGSDSYLLAVFNNDWKLHNYEGPAVISKNMNIGMHFTYGGYGFSWHVNGKDVWEYVELNVQDKFHMGEKSRILLMTLEGTEI